MDVNLVNQPFSSSSLVQKEIEAFVVNTVKVKMIKKLDSLLEKEGKINARKLFLVPLFTVTELTKRVEMEAPEIKTLFYRELVETVEEMEKRLACNIRISEVEPRKA